VRLYFGKPILQIFYPYTNAPIRNKKATHRRVMACVCMFVNPPCKYVTSIQTHPSEKKKATHLRVISCVCILVNPSCKYFTKIQSNNPKTNKASSCHRRSSDQKIARFRSHLSEYRLGTHIGQTIYKILNHFLQTSRYKMI
jgi:hypothetical protein